jgi:uncharacterized metal-binding protein YceD (DUF177 family)
VSASREFSRPVLLARVASEPYRQQISANAAERAALARRFDLVSLERLDAVVELVREGGQTILLHADFEAAFEQNCIVTLDPIAGALADRFVLRYGPPDAEPAAADMLDEDVAFEPITGETIDIGEAVAQEFSLVLPPFPRSPDAAVEGDTAPGAPSSDRSGSDRSGPDRSGSDRSGPDGSGPDGSGLFAGLSRLFDRGGGEK